MKYIEESQAWKMFNNYLDEVHGVISLGGAEYLPSKVLEEIDQINYIECFRNWLDSEDLTIDESDADDLEDC